MENQLIKVAQESGLEKTQSELILSKFTGFFEQAKEWEMKAKALVITDVSQVKEMKQAREARLALKEIRVNAENVRKEEKEMYLRGGKAIDGIANVIKALIVPIEEHLEKQEKFVEVQEEARKEKINQERILKLSQFILDTTIYNLKEMSEDAFIELLKNSEIAQKAVKDAELKAEEERVKKEKADKLEQERVRAENEKLKKEAEAREKEMEKERVKNEKKMKEEREAREKAEKELQAKKDAELEAIKKANEEAEKLASSSDKEKLVALANTFDNLDFPKVVSLEAKALIREIKNSLELICVKLRK